MRLEQCMVQGHHCVKGTSIYRSSPVIVRQAWENGKECTVPDCGELTLQSGSQPTRLRCSLTFSGSMITTTCLNESQFKNF